MDVSWINFRQAVRRRVAPWWGSHACNSCCNIHEVTKQRAAREYLNLLKHSTPQIPLMQAWIVGSQSSTAALGSGTQFLVAPMWNLFLSTPLNPSLIPDLHRKIQNKSGTPAPAHAVTTCVSVGGHMEQGRYRCPFLAKRR
jgi:hypothetical protein